MKKQLFLTMSAVFTLGINFLSYAEVKVVTSDSPQSQAHTEALLKQEAEEAAKVKAAKEKGELYIPGLGNLGKFSMFAETKSSKNK